MKKSSKPKTKQEAMTPKILMELVVLVKFFEKFPKGRGDDKKWVDGMLYGVKYAIVHITEKFIDDDNKNTYKKLIDWEKEEEQLLKKERQKRN